MNKIICDPGPKEVMDVFRIFTLLNGDILDPVVEHSSNQNNGGFDCFRNS